jgi:hypothetical protein
MNALSSTPTKTALLLPTPPKTLLKPYQTFLLHYPQSFFDTPPQTPPTHPTPPAKSPTSDLLQDLLKSHKTPYLLISNSYKYFP